MAFRFDKYASMLGWFSRREAKQVHKRNTFLVNGEILDKVERKIHVWDTLTWKEYNLELEVVLDVAVILHKPSWYISADHDEHGWPSYRALLQDFPYTNMLHVAGRLDQDTEWLLLLTSDGKLTHRIISPKKKVPKRYYVETKNAIKDCDLVRLRDGVTLEDGSVTLPAECVRLGDNTLELSIVEGKFHQVKRMLQAVANEVVYLKRTSIGWLSLWDLEQGQWKKLTDEDIAQIFSIWKQ